VNITFWISLNTSPIRAEFIGNAYRFTLSNIGLMICFLELYVNIFAMNTLKSVKQRLMDKASKDNYIDSLTCLGNRRMFNRVLPTLEKESGDHLCVALIDIDFFKKINDTYGHAAGDKALVFLADTMNKFFRTGDILIRWGGEEFMILLRQTDITNAEALMERFRAKIQNSPIDLDNCQINISITVGVTEHCFGKPLNDSIKKADELMYQGKAQGRNRVVSGALPQNDENNQKK